MSDEDQRHQQMVHDALAHVLAEVGMIEKGEALTGYVVCFEKLNPKGEAFASRIFGPAGMTSWRAQGLVDWLSGCPDYEEAEDE